MKAFAKRVVEASKVAELDELRDPITHDEVLKEPERTRDALAAPQRRLEAYPVASVARRTDRGVRLVVARRHRARRREQPFARRVEAAGGQTMMNALKRLVSSLLIVCTVTMGMPLPASAGIVSTDRIAAGAERDRLASFLDRAEVQAQMQALGVDPQAAIERVGALSDDEVASLAGRLDQLPAGGHDIVGALLLVFIILLITDILGYTKIFPFTRPIQK